jgi:hypothetical protein
MRTPAPALLVLALTLALQACAANDRASDVLPGEQSASGGARQVINALGTPVHALVKGVSCVATGAVAVPLASAFQITGHPQDRGLQQDTYKTVGRTCGGSYVLGAPDDLPPSP